MTSTLSEQGCDADVMPEVSFDPCGAIRCGSNWEMCEECGFCKSHCTCGEEL